MLQEFKQFLLRGNVVDLAVAVVTALVQDLITPLVSMIVGQGYFGTLSFTINDSQFFYGHFINALLSFVIIAAVVFFLVVKPVNFLMQRARSEPPADPTTMKCPECLSEIPLEARRCAFCTSEVAGAKAYA